MAGITGLSQNHFTKRYSSRGYCDIDLDLVWEAMSLALPKLDDHLKTLYLKLCNVPLRCAAHSFVTRLDGFTEPIVNASHGKDVFNRLNY